MAGDETNDAELVRRFNEGDALAFDALVRRHQDRLFRLVSVWLYDPSRAEDATQEVFLRAYRGLGRFRFRAEPFTWLFRTARLVCLEMNRQRRYEPLPTEDPPAADSGDSAIALAEVRALVSDLPARQREVVMLRIFEDLSVSETARAMGCREGTVKALLNKARKQLAGSYSE